MCGQGVAASLTFMEIEQFAQVFERLAGNIESVIVGKRGVVEGCLIALLAGGHVLLEDVPGVGKTMMARTMARTLGASYKRIQFTPDLLPSDVTGTVVFDQNANRDGRGSDGRVGDFVFREGPVFSHVVLADEINRASPKTQSALLECMEEGTVTADLKTHHLPLPFFVIATQNPTEYEGVYPLPESQLDRFAMRLAIGYPSPASERELMRRQRVRHPIEDLGSVTDVEEVRQMQGVVRAVAFHDDLYDYVLRLANATRNHRQLLLGLSPRGCLMLSRAAQALAASRRRDYATPDDVKAVAVPVIAHRLIAHPEARMSGVAADHLVEDLLRTVPVETPKNA